MPEASLSLRTLNRTHLVRQLLVERSTLPALDTIRHLVAVQGQEPNWPYVGLWTRLVDFRREDLAALLDERAVVRGTTLRRTVHLTTAEDFLWLRPSVLPIVMSALKTAYFADEIEGMDLAELEKAGRELITGRELTRREFAKLLGERYPDRLPRRLAEAVEVMIPMVHGTAVGAWGGWSGAKNVSVSIAEETLGAPLVAGPEPEKLILRYLTAFGPAGVMDVQAWSGTTRLREVMNGMRDRLRVYKSEEGQELFDVPDGPIADADLPVPVRFLPAFDNAVLGYKDRTRMISEDDRKQIAWEGSAGVPLFLVDGFVRGRWSIKADELRVTPFRPLTPAEQEAVSEEATYLLAFLVPDGATLAPVIEHV
ncbi:AlkZ family DNA glycosylase [Actinomadura barringtoniae]|uniref:AlkZ family DNA glycosylase n=1 Tax=Actinomadura barringtoniae TaxID=1427535 RepID=A0A939PIV7_9ACTN|nr:winged helix DNA-binding domain-containing protein [Actinomadura barringtoniae]MBO2452983.1 AlkZ family DNA glycosylase [Actinomadura barringtoniae]